MVVGNSKLMATKKAGKLLAIMIATAGNYDCHGDAAVRCGAHRPMEHIQGFTRSHWMLPLVECLRRIAPAAAMVN